MSNTLVLEEASSLPIPTGERPPPTKSPGLEALLAMAQASDFADIERAAGEGATVVWGFIMGWNPLFRALNVISGEMGLIADSIKFSADAVSVAESYFQIPEETCTPVKARAGLHHMRRKTTNIKRHVQFAGDCGMSDVMSELLRKEGLEVYAVEPISPFKFDPTRRDEFVRFYVDETPSSHQARATRTKITPMPTSGTTALSFFAKRSCVTRRDLRRGFSWARISSELWAWK